MRGLEPPPPPVPHSEGAQWRDPGRPQTSRGPQTSAKVQMGVLESARRGGPDKASFAGDAVKIVATHFCDSQPPFWHLQNRMLH